MRHPNPLIEQYRVGGIANDQQGAFIVKVRTKFRGRQLNVLVGNGMGWDHVSVSHPLEIPNWEEMSVIKTIFFDPEEVVMQLHVASKDHINVYPNCLHLWRPQTAEQIARIRTEWGNEWEWGDLAPQGIIPLPPIGCV